jgi:hypothetical protein
MLTTSNSYYTPFMYAATVFMSIGSGLLTTFTTSTHHSHWIGYQFMFGAGVGMGMQQTMVATQTVLPKADIAIGTSIMMFSQSLGGALFASVGQNLFTNKLIQGIQAQVAGVDPRFVLSVGATQIKDRLDPASWPGVQIAYNDAVVRTFYVCVALSCLSSVGAAFIQWKSVKGKKVVAVAA